MQILKWLSLVPVLASSGCGGRTSLGSLGNGGESAASGASTGSAPSTIGVSSAGGNPSSGSTQASGGNRSTRVETHTAGTLNTGGSFASGGTSASGGARILRKGFVRCGNSDCDLQSEVCCASDGPQCVTKTDPYSACTTRNGSATDLRSCDQSGDCGDGQVCCSVTCKGQYNASLSCMAARDCVLTSSGVCSLRQACDPAATRPLECLNGICWYDDAINYFCGE
jgi:hypothetical protein